MNKQDQDEFMNILSSIISGQKSWEEYIESNEQ